MSIRTNFIAAAACVLAPIPAWLPSSSPSREDDRAAIEAHIRQIFDAYVRGDRDVIRETHSEDWCGYLSRTTTMIDGIDAYMRNAEQTLASPNRMKEYEFVELEIRFHDDVALIPYVARLYFDYGGERISTLIRSLDVYQKRAGGWIQIGSNLSMHPDAAATRRTTNAPALPFERQQLMSTRERVWRAIFADDAEELARLIPDEVIAVNSARHGVSRLEDVRAYAAGFEQDGGKLKRLAFPTTEIQLYWDLAILYSTYELELERGGEASTSRGNVTEVFVRRDGGWVNVGWHMDYD